MSDHVIPFGPPVPVVPAGHFCRLPFNPEDMEALWRIVGPSVARNMARGQPMWRVIVAAYAEGLSHGAAAEREWCADA